MGQFLKHLKLPKSNQDETDYLNSPITIEEAEFVI